MKKRNIRWSLRGKVALAFIVSLCISSLFSYGIIHLVLKFFYQGEVTKEVASFFCLIAILLAAVLGVAAMWIGSGHLTKSLLVISEAAKEVAKGDFTIVIPRNEKARGRYSYTNELDELAENFNKMTRELAAMEYMRKDFMSNVSHEVKTPVAAITGFTELLLDGGLSPEEQREYLSLVNEESLRLSRLCENMLMMSRLDHQRIIQKEKVFSLDEQLRQCIIMVSEKWIDKPMDFILSLSPVQITANYDLLYQVWTNLLDNAVKYSLEGSRIWVQVKETADAVEVMIRDEGCGISTEKLERIFEKFYQCEESHKKQGSGLGLAIVRRIVELMEGTIDCESEAGKGTCMKVTLKKIKN